MVSKYAEHNKKSNTENRLSKNFFDVFSDVDEYVKKITNKIILLKKNN